MDLPSLPVSTTGNYSREQMLEFQKNTVKSCAKNIEYLIDYCIIQKDRPGANSGVLQHYAEAFSDAARVIRKLK